MLATVTRVLAVLLVLALGAGCGDRYVVVSIVPDGQVEGIELFRVTVENAGQTSQPLGVAPPSRGYRLTAPYDFALEFPPQRSGPVTVTVQALGLGAGLLSEGKGMGMIAPGAATTIIVRLRGNLRPDLLVTDVATPDDAGVVDLTMPDLGVVDQAVLDLVRPPDLVRRDVGPVCDDPCPNVGATRCLSSGTLETCGLSGGCLRWSQSACGADQVCCGTACVAADPNNCYACGMKCSGAQPTCSPVLKRCACSSTSCWPGGQACNGSTGACTPCPSLTAESAEVFVDASGPAGGTGTPGCPFRTISAALSATNGWISGPTIRVAAGTYDATAGEVFPLVLRRGISLVGAGAGRTNIIGSGRYDHSVEGGANNGVYQATIVAGNNASITSTISNLSLKPSTNVVVPSGGYYGVLCDRGNAPAAANPPPTPFPSPSVHVNGVTLGPSYNTALVASTSTMNPSGCNLLVTASQIVGCERGIWAVGCGTGLGALPVALRVGTGNEPESNRLSQLGIGVEAWDCVSPVMLRRNTFELGGIGFELMQHPTTMIPFVEVADNTFNQLEFGVRMFFTSVIEQLVRNRFTGITAGTRANSGVALRLDSAQNTDINGSGPKVRRARANEFVGNDIGVEIAGSPFRNGSVPTRTDFDFGRANDPGNNVFACNSRLGASAGCDLYIHVNAGSDVPPLAFAGNFWDMLPLRAVNALTAVNGTEIVNGSMPPAPSIDASVAQLANVNCPAGRIR